MSRRHASNHAMHSSKLSPWDIMPAIVYSFPRVRPEAISSSFDFRTSSSAVLESIVWCDQVVPSPSIANSLYFGFLTGALLSRKNSEKVNVLGGFIRKNSL